MEANNQDALVSANGDMVSVCEGLSHDLSGRRPQHEGVARNNASSYERLRTAGFGSLRLLAAKADLKSGRGFGLFLQFRCAYA